MSSAAGIRHIQINRFIMKTDIFENYESGVMSYARSFPVVFRRARGCFLYDEEGTAYLDFLAGAGALNYGHNNPTLKGSLIEYLEDDSIVHSLDMHTVAKREFMDTFQEVILKPRGLSYRMQFTGPTGTNAVEAALKIARNVQQREYIISFSNGFHGVSLGALSATGNSFHRGAAGMGLAGVSHMPYDGYLGDDIDTTEYLDKVLSDASSGVDLPAAVVVETVQGEGGINAAGFEWLRNLERVCRKHDVLLIVDDIQAGCGRTGTFFSFEEADICPDIVTLSKSLSGYGLPFALVLMKPELDQWKPGEHNGTFRGHNPAFVTATAALKAYWRDEKFGKQIRAKGAVIGEELGLIAREYGSEWFTTTGRGMMRGLVCRSGNLAERIVRACFERNLVIETSGADGQVVKILCPLTISEEDLRHGLKIIRESVDEVMDGYRARRDSGKHREAVAI